MADEMARAQAIGDLASKPKIFWHRQQDGAVMSATSALPIYFATVAATVKELVVMLGGGYTSGSASDAAILVALLRNNLPIYMFSSSFQNAWAGVKTVIATPDWSMEPDDIITVTIVKSGGGVLLPSLSLCVSIEP